METIGDMRNQIDDIDRQIARLLVKRSECVKTIGHLKGSADKVHDPEREKQVIANVRAAAAEEQGSDLALIEKIYWALIKIFSEYEKDESSNKD
jgi:chorismate mutase